MLLDALAMVDLPRDFIQKDITAYIEKELVPGKKVDEPTEKFDKEELTEVIEFVLGLLKCFRSNKDDVEG